MVDQTNQFRTSDTPLAAYLIQDGFNLLCIEYENRGGNGWQQATFVFDDSGGLREKVSLYNRGEATINIALYEHAKQRLLDRVKRGLP